MSLPLPTCQVRVVVFDSAGGAPVAGAQVQAQLSSYDVGDGYVVPRLVVGTTDIDGEAFLDLWPNQLGSSESFYTVTITAPNGKRLRTIAVVPNQPTADLQDIAELPPYDGKPDAAIYLNTVVQAAQDVTQKAQQVNDDAEAATQAAGIAIQKANDAGQKASDAEQFASNAAGFADAAAASDESAGQHEAAAAAQAGVATAASNNAQAASRSPGTWTFLAGLTPTVIGEGAEVPDSDTGTHVDPSTSLPVPNAGRYKGFATTLGAWERIGPTGLYGKTSIAVVNQVPSVVYLYGQQLAGWVKDTNGRIGVGIAQDSTLLAKLPLVQGSGITITRSAADGKYTIASTGGVTGVTSGLNAISAAINAGTLKVSLGTTEGVVPVGGGWIDGRGLNVYIGGVKVVGGIKGTDGRWPIWVGEDGKGHVHGLVVPTPADYLLKEAAAYGDSLTAGAGGGGSTIIGALATALGIPGFNRGIGGQTSNQIAQRQSGNVVTATLSGNQIVAGANTVTEFNGAAVAGMSTNGARDQPLSTASDNTTRSMSVSLCGVTGTLTRTANAAPSTVEGYTFTPDAGQALPVTCPTQSPMLVLSNVFADTRRINILWPGRNNDWTSPTQIMSDLDAMTKVLIEAGNRRFVVMTVINGNYAAEYAGASRYVQLMAINRAIMRRYPNNVVDVRSYLINRALAYLGITPTAQDLIDIGNDTVPTSCRAVGDNIHLNGITYAAIGANLLAPFITAKGWV
ncbi:hypothetical protein ABIC63_002129 [Pseudacidovorax sp. 1753]|uniref:hypothetical protein n=1 Tax=Pseudacidovorax sp. 1753 TaxID=3156419 RepID=UPI00339228EE